MFLLFKTKRDEDVLINVDKISFILKAKKGNATIYDEAGNEFSSSVSYEHFMQQFFSKVPITKIY